ncbi:hypothetical protein BGX26_002201 [Mortierella sp. AD094]|nr:hypothetical protein BGX26_002201 [Mortierella sp. AD094]
MKFSITLAVIALSTAIAFTQAAPTKTEPLAAEVADAAYIQGPVHTCGPAFPDSNGNLVKRTCMGGAEAMAVDEIEAQVVATTTAEPTPTPTRVCHGGPVHDKRGLECPM